MWSSEPIPFDAMEIAIHEAYAKLDSVDERPNFKLVHEYPLGGQPPMMTHVFENSKGKQIIAAKGAPEALMEVTQLAQPKRSKFTCHSNFGERWLPSIGSWRLQLYWH